MSAYAKSNDCPHVTSATGKATTLPTSLDCEDLQMTDNGMRTAPQELLARRTMLTIPACANRGGRLDSAEIAHT
ncbi:hypothetical protein BSZ19_18445 [Bradyrhizobium japonicum]|uniref:Uncharacterized protein n=1 Tax=Bradyrhizobium japonicum TaxID=375 RepID=A0A1Y2JNM9_BRAJP|nr:hypothetical protein BSZ19_18445 [Bradyrhizobium japonicum]